MRSLRTWLLFVFFGTAGTVLVRVLYKGFALIQSGMERDAVSPVRLLRDYMLIEEYAIYGAAGGAAIGCLILFIKLIAYIASRAKKRATGNKSATDPDAIIRADREAKADAYMAKRRLDQTADG